MMGQRDRDQGQLFYEFKLDDVVPRNHLLRERIRTPGCARRQRGCPRHRSPQDEDQSVFEIS
jgi:hypothetical protein